jgi:hypothetical protein
MKKLSGDELAKEIGCDASTLKKTCEYNDPSLTPHNSRKKANNQSTTITTTPRTQDQTHSTKRLAYSFELPTEQS